MPRTVARPLPDAGGDIAGLEQALRRAVDGDVRFDAGTRALYATDASNYRQVPLGVVTPRDADDVEAAVSVCRELDAPVLPRGAGTSLAGQCCNVAVVLDLSRWLDRVGEVDPDARTVQAEPGAVLDRVQEQAARHGLMFGPDPSTHAWCTVGGMIGNNACGVHSLVSGTTADNVDRLDVLTYDGARLTAGPLHDAAWAAAEARGGRLGDILSRLRRLRDRCGDAVRAGFPELPRRVSGYNLDRLLPEGGGHVARALVGTEGTCALVLGATLRLIPRPAARVLLVLGYDGMEAAADAVPALLEHRPFGLEGFDDHLLAGLARHGRRAPGQDRLPDGRAWLLLEMAGDTVHEAVSRARALQAGAGGRAARETRLVEDAAEQALLWAVREAGVGATSRVPGLGDCWPGWEDAAVAPAHLGDYVRAFRGLLARHGLESSLYGHFGDGCIHARINFPLQDVDGARALRAFVEEAADLVVAHGGSLSGEHGDGQSRGELLEKMMGPELVAAFREFKGIWDPRGRLNPGKVVDPRPLDADLRVRTPLIDVRSDETFAYRSDDGSLGRAVSRCVGVGKCLRDGPGTMCPSYRATRDERHSTRGRSRLLFEMLAGDVLTGGWNDPAVKEALDLCLACKACKSECPAGVDMATYKAEFLSRYHEKNGRSLGSAFFGLMPLWARAGAWMPAVANRMLEIYAVESVLKRATGLAPGRSLPHLASPSFRRWFRRRGNAAGGRRDGTGRRVVLWPDTWNAYFTPEVAQGAVRTLEASGFAVSLPSAVVCCGRPLYDQGMVHRARRWLGRVLDVLEDDLAAGLPVVVLEPSCLSVFHDELLQLHPDDPRAVRLAAQSTSLDGFLLQHAEEAVAGLVVEPADASLLVQGHCHRQALDGLEQQSDLLRRLGAEVSVLDHGCCGMAGAFGFSRDHVGVALAVGERGVLPAVRAAPAETLVLADGFSCREQIRQTTSRRARHLAEIVRPRR